MNSHNRPGNSSSMPFYSGCSLQDARPRAGSAGPGGVSGIARPGAGEAAPGVCVATHGAEGRAAGNAGNAEPQETPVNDFGKIRIHITHECYTVMYLGKPQYKSSVPDTSLHVTYNAAAETAIIYSRRYTLYISAAGGTLNIEKKPPAKPDFSGAYKAL